MNTNANILPIKIFFLVFFHCFLLSLSNFSNGQTEATYLTNIRQLTYEGKRAGEGYFSPDGKKIIFQSEREANNPFYQIYILDFETGETHRVSPGIGKTTCAFFRPGSNEVLFGSTHLDPAAQEKQQTEINFRLSGQKRRYAWDYDETMDIFACQQDGSNCKQLTNALGYDAEAAYSPDGSKIVFSSLRAGYENNLSPEEKKRLEIDPAYFGEIYIMNADGSNQQRLTNMPGYDGGPFFSADGQRIIWRHFNEEGTVADVYSMKLDGSDQKRLTDFNSMSWAPYFHPSGEYAIFTSNKLGFDNFELYIVDAEGTREPVRISFTDGFDGLPVFSPDGKQLCWTASRTTDGKAQLFIANWNHVAAQKAIAQAPARGSKTTPLATHNHIHDHEPAAPAPLTLPHTAETAPISSAELKAKIEYLASPKLEGRMTGTKGAQLAAQYIANHFEKTTLQKIPPQTSYFTPFTYTAGIEFPPTQNLLSLTNKIKSQTFKYKKDFTPLGMSDNGTVEGQVVFAGYGIKVPGDTKDYYADIDVKDKIVLVLDGIPQDVAADRKQVLYRYADLRYKALLAREHGAKALLVYAPQTGELLKVSNDRSLSGSGIITLSIHKKVFENLWATTEKNWNNILGMLNVENISNETVFEFPNNQIKLQATIVRVEGRDQNIVGIIPPAQGNDYILIGAHYDHLGHGEVGSLARKGEEKHISHGADDNASGTATVLELAEYFTNLRHNKPELFQKGIIFACWSGEEIGLIGSSYFAEHCPLPLQSIKACLNFDMVGRMQDNKLYLQGVGSSPDWTKLIEKRNISAGFSLGLQTDPYLPTDATSFYLKNIPILNFFTGMHEDYHRPTDRPEKVNYTDLERITNFARVIAEDLIKTPDTLAYNKVENTASTRRASAAIYLGTIPDYTAEATGLKLSGVRPGGPAEQAGLQAGDIIIELAGQTIKNIYDYTYALDTLTIDETVSVVVLREGKRIELQITPKARK